MISTKNSNSINITAVKGRTYVFDDFTDLTFIAQGGYGTVIGAKLKSTGESVALKFFGYVGPSGKIGKPQLEWIEAEIRDLMQLCSKINGVVQCLGSFNDTAEGYISNLSIQTWVIRNNR